MAEQRLDGVIIDVDGAPLRTELYGRLVLVRVDESTQLPDSFEIRIDDPHFELFDEDAFKLGTRIQIAFRADTEPIVVTSGEITAMCVEPGVSGRHELVLTGLDLTHRLARGAKARTFANMTDADIARRVAADYGLDAEIDATAETREHTFQSSETDYAFLRRLATRIGYDFWISEQTFYFKRRPAGPATPTLTWGENLRDFSVRFTSTEMCDEVVVTAWNAVDKRTITGRAQTPDPGTDAPAAEQMAAAARQTFGQVTRTAGQFPAATQAEADARAAALLLHASGGQVVLRGEAIGNPWIGAGMQIQLERVGTRLAGKYRVTSVEHRYGSGRPYTTRFTCGGKEADGLADLLSGGGGGLKRGWGSLVVGVVTNNEDPDQQARVKVRFPTLSEDESAWCRVVAPGAGEARGMQWLPEVGDEVLVGFEHDDKGRPIVLGGMWSQQDKPPEGAPTDGGQVTDRVMATRKDHRLVFTDDPTSKIELKLGDADCLLHLEQSESKLTGERKLVISAQQVEIKADQKLTLDAAMVELSASGSMTVSGKPIKLN